MLTLISLIESRRLRNAEHVQLFNDVCSVIETAEPEALGLPATIYSSFASAVGKEQDIVNKAQGSTYTKDMEVADKERNTTFHRFFHLIGHRHRRTRTRFNAFIFKS